MNTVDPGAADSTAALPPARLNQVCPPHAAPARWDTIERPRAATLAEEHTMRVVARALAGWDRRPHTAHGIEPYGLRLAVVCDLSESMAPVAAHMASLAWVLTAAAQHAAWPPHLDQPDPVHTVIVSAHHSGTDYRDADRHQPRPINTPACSGPSTLHEATAAAALGGGLDTWEAGRLLVLITGAVAAPEVLDRARAHVAELQRRGAGVLWLCPASLPCRGDTFPGATVGVIDPDRHLDSYALGALAVTALRHSDPRAFDPARDDPDPWL